MNKYTLLVCCVCILGSCKYFSAPASHDQEFAEKLTKIAMNDKYRANSHYESVSFGPVTVIKDSVININGSRVGLHHHKFMQIENKYVLKDPDGNITDKLSAWLVIDSAFSEAICCMVKK